MVLGLLDQPYIFWQLDLLKFLGLLIGLGLLELSYLMCLRRSTGFGILVFFKNFSLMEFQVKYLAWLCCFLAKDDFDRNFLKALFLVLHFSYYTLMTFLMMLYVILLSMLMILLSTPSHWCYWTENGARFHEEKSSFKMLSFSSKLDWGTYIISVSKIVSKKFLSPEVVLVLCKSTITSYCGRCSSELAELVPLPYSRARSTHYSDRFHDFFVTIRRRYKDTYVNSFAQLDPGITCL